MTALPSAPGETIEAGVFKASNRVEEIALVSNQGLDFYDDMEPALDNDSLVYTPSSDTQF